MTSSGQSPAETSGGRLREVGLVIGLALLVCAVAISSQSFWIDECGVAYKAAMPQLSQFWHHLSTEGSADLQQPFHHFLTWAWARFFGIQEFAFRAANIPFLVVGLVAVWAGFRTEPRLRLALLLFVLFSAFTWAYLNEARPYAVQIGASLLVFSAIHALARAGLDKAGETRWTLLLCLGALLLASSGMLAMLWLGAYLLAVILATPIPMLLQRLRQHAILYGLTAVGLLAMGGFYLWTLSIGARATAVGTTDARNLGFIAFELLGFGGIGPGRLAIRNEGLRAFKPWLPYIAVYGLFASTLFLAGLRQLRLTLPRRPQWAWPLAIGLVACFIFAVGVVVRFRVLGRHCTPLLPLVLFVLACGAVHLWTSRRTWMRGVVAGFVVMSLISCSMIRFANRHAKDDYRGAASLASAALNNGQTVWWNANVEGAIIYGLSTNPPRGRIAFLVNPEAGFDTNNVSPDIVLASKPDVYDAWGAMAEFLKRQDFRPATNLTAFTAWQRGAP